MEGTAPETGNLHATLGIEDDDFSGEDNYGLAFLNLAADGAPEVPTNIDSINYDTVFKQSGGKVNPTWVLLDNQSTVNVFSIPDIVVNIYETSQEMHVYCNSWKLIIWTVGSTAVASPTSYPWPWWNKCSALHTTIPWVQMPTLLWYTKRVVTN